MATISMIDPHELTSNNIYDRLAAAYTLTFDTNYSQYLKYLLLERFTKPGDVCLDVGIGNGIFAIPIASKVRAVHGVDISPKMLEECRRNLERAGVRNVHLHERSATDLPFSDASFDFAFSHATLLIVPNPERAYREIVRVLKPGAFAVLDITGKFNLSRIVWAKYYRSQGHFGVNAYGLRGIQAVFTSLGLDMVERHATGVLDQWKYVPGLARLGVLESAFHARPREPDLDYKASQRLPGLANRWYFVLRRRGA